MTTYDLDDDNLYLGSLYHAEIRIRRNTKPTEVIADWEDFKIVNTMDDGLKVYDVIIFGLKLRELAAELTKYKMYINRQGYCYARLDYDGEMAHKLNDLFSWSKYGVVPNVATIWNRCDMNTNAIVIDYEKTEKELGGMKLQLEENGKAFHRLNTTLELKSRELAEKDEELRKNADYIEKKDRELSVKKRTIALKDRELSEQGRTITLKDQELRDCKLLLEKRERELSILITLWERHLGASNGASRWYQERIYMQG